MSLQLSKGVEPGAVFICQKGCGILSKVASRYKVGRCIRCSGALNAIPVFVKDGSVIPMCDIMQSTAEYAQSPITFHCFGKSAKGIFIEDDGNTFDYEDGSYNEWRIKVDEGKFVAQPVELGFDSARRNFNLLHGGNLESISLSIS